MTTQTSVQSKAVSAVNIMKNVMLFQIECHIWSGAQVLKGQDLTKVDKDDLPPPFLASLGSKKLIDVTHLKVFTTLKRQAERVLENYGIEFMGGYAVSLTKVDAVALELESIEKLFEVAKTDFFANYDKYCTEWSNLNPEWKHAIEAKPVPIEKVTISFDWLPTIISAPTGKKNQALINRCNEKVEGLSDKLFIDIAKEASEAIDKSMCGKDRVTQSVMQRLANIRQKLDDLSFINSSASYIVSAIDYISSLMPPSGYIDGASFNALYQLFELLAKPQVVLEFGEACRNGEPVETLISEHCTYAVDSIQTPKKPSTKSAQSQVISKLDEPNLFDFDSSVVSVSKVVDTVELAKVAQSPEPSSIESIQVHQPKVVDKFVVKKPEKDIGFTQSPIFF